MWCGCGFHSRSHFKRHCTASPDSRQCDGARTVQAEGQQQPMDDCDSTELKHYCYTIYILYILE